MSKTNRKIAWSTFVQLFGKGIQIFCGILAVKIITNALGTENYGIYGKISEFALFFSVAGNLGIFGNTVRKMSASPKDGSIFINALFLRFGTALLFFGAGLIFALIAIKDPMFLWGTIIFMASLLLDYIVSICDSAMQANYIMGRATIALTLGRFLNVGTVFLISYSGIHVAPLYFLGPLFGSILSMALSLYFVMQKIRPVFKLNWQMQKELLISSLPFGIINIINNLYFRFLPSAIIAKILTDQAFGSYEISMRIAGTVSIFSTVLMFSALPALRLAIVKNDLKETKQIFKNAKKTLFIFGLLAIICGSILAPFAIQIVSNKTFLIDGFEFLLPLLLVLAVVSYFYDLAFITLFAMNKDLWWLKRELFALAISAVIILATINFDAISANILSVQTKVFLVIISAILAEGFMAFAGMRKIAKTKSLIGV
ncbi:MAG: oligosaccharide flippase family protein [Candidatus Gracilibacteria bacterium]